MGERGKTEFDPNEQFFGIILKICGLVEMSTESAKDFSRHEVAI